MFKKIIAGASCIALLSGCGSKVEQSNTEVAEQLSIQIPSNTESLSLDTENSVLNWQGMKITGASHEGTAAITDGALFVDGQEPTGGDFIIDMTQMTNLDQDGSSSEQLLGHLKSEDFFDIAQYPSARIQLTKVTPSIKRNFKVEADLTIKGNTNPISFDAEINVEEKTANAQFSIDRTLWDVRYGSGKFFKGLGDNLIKDQMNFDLTLQFQ